MCGVEKATAHITEALQSALERMSVEEDVVSGDLVYEAFLPVVVGAVVPEMEHESCG